MKSCADPQGRNHLGYRNRPESQRINGEMRQTAPAIIRRGDSAPARRAAMAALWRPAFGAEATGSEAAPLYQPLPARLKAARNLPLHPLVRPAGRTGMDLWRRQALQFFFGLAASFATVFVEGHGRLLPGVIPEPMSLSRYI